MLTLPWSPDTLASASPPSRPSRGDGVARLLPTAGGPTADVALPTVVMFMVPMLCYMGPDGAGHFVRMVHNGIEYADMQLSAAYRW
jgi:6-phosphogluconate dehydrogenase, C-terminal domain